MPRADDVDSRANRKGKHNPGGNEEAFTSKQRWHHRTIPFHEGCASGNPPVNGARIDDIVDYLTFVVLPMLLLDRFGFLPSPVALLVVAIVLLSSAYGFGSADAKTADHFFTGFPSYWNIVALYLYIFAVPP